MDEIYKQLQEVILDNYQSIEHFKSAYNLNPDRVFSKISNSLKVIPYNIKYLLANYYKQITTYSTDNYVA